MGLVSIENYLNCLFNADIWYVPTLWLKAFRGLIAALLEFTQFLNVTFPYF